MGKFGNVSVIKKANIYFDGLVPSRTVRFEDGMEWWLTTGYRTF